MTTQCFHCGLDNPSGTDYCLELFNQNRRFCCAGCLAIAENLKQNNLLEFYRFRDAPSNKPESLIPQELLELESIDNPNILDEISQKDNQSRKIELGIEGITCAACGWLIEKQIKSLPYVEYVSVNVSTNRALLRWNQAGQLSDILKALLKLGYKGFPFTEDQQEKSYQNVNRLFIKRLLVAALGMMQVMTYALAIYIGEFQDLHSKHQLFMHWLSGIVATPVVFYSALPFFQSAINNLKVKQFGMNLPVSIAILAAYLASLYSLLTGGNVYYFDSVVMFTFFLLIGRFLEHRARYRSLLKQQNFSRLLPLTVNKRSADGSTSTISLNQVEVGDYLLIYPGNTIPVDGVLCERSAEINQAIITGEFLPVTKTPGDSLLSGTSNQSSTLVMQVTNPVDKSHLQSLIELQKRAEQLKPSSLSLADKIAHWYVLILLILVLASGAFWMQYQPENTFAVILSILVVSCPCALSLATPAAIAAATTKLSEIGLMLRTSSSLENLAKIQHIYFDKTGTLTTGSIKLIDTKIYQPTVNSSSKVYSEEEVLQIAHLLERISNHPVTQAFNYPKHKLTMQATDLAEQVGAGVSGRVDGQLFHIGNREFIQQFGVEVPPVDKTADHGLQSHGKTKLYLVDQQRLVAEFLLSDSLRPSAKPAISRLNDAAYNLGIISGDQPSSVSSVANQLDIKHYHASMTPADKLDFIHRLQSEGNHCLMIGDGFNDVGALSAASMSITLANGVQLSKSSSGAVLISDDLGTIAKALALSKKVNRVIKQNLAWAIGYNLIAVPFAVAGLVPAWLAAIGMSLSSLVVVLNALRLRK